MTATTIKKPEWVEKLPNGWDLLPVRAVLKERNEKNSKLEISNILSVMKGVGVIRYEDKGNVGNKSSNRPEAYKIVRSQDIVLNSMNLSIGSVGIAREEGVTSSVYIIYQARIGVANPDFYNYLFQTVPFQRHLASYGHGIMELREAVKERDIRNQPIIVPPIETQKRIADFLDEKTRIIDELVTKKESLIELLREKRAAIITQAVTKGLDPKAKMKPSGIEWLGEIPEKWEVKRLKFAIRTNPSKREAAATLDDEVSFIPMEAITEDGAIDLSTVKTFKEVMSGYTYFRNDDVVIAKITPCFENGKGALMKNLINGFGFGTTEFHVLRAVNVDPNYIYLITKIYPFRNFGKVNMTGVAGQKRVTDRFINDFALGLPQMPEQRKIIETINREMAKVDELVEKSEIQITQLKEYRSSLIYSAVTGKIEI